jgi:glycosyltransferase involved in cell wall biosynthesis
MRQIAERMAARGHLVTVATSRHPARKSRVVNGVHIRQFKAAGKMAYRLHGQIAAYRDFVRQFDADAVLVMAAQQWSFDALWPILDDIKARKVFIPCGFSGFFEPDFATYFEELPAVLRKFDHLIFNAEKYRDIDFARKLGLTSMTVVPNGISEVDFDCAVDPNFRQKLGIPEDAFLFLTVGNPIEAKGHRDVVEAFAQLETDGRSAVLLAIAGWSSGQPGAAGRLGIPRFVSRMIGVIQTEGIGGLGRIAYGRFYNSRLGHLMRLTRAVVRRLSHILRAEGCDGIKQLVRRKMERRRAAGMVANTSDVVVAAPLESIQAIAARASQQPLKRVILTDLARPDLIQAYMAADLFVFASRIEYSPLVLFEAAAAGTPFLTVPVGNADEIVRWTGSGILCEASKDERGYTRVDPRVLASDMARCMKDCEGLSRLGTIGRARWHNYFTWKVVVTYYEDILAGRTPKIRMTEGENTSLESSAT